MKIDKTTDALIVVDVQNDFCPGGALPVAQGDRIIPIINRLTPRFRKLVFTRDWHPANHCSFTQSPKFVDGSWPLHCVAETPGALFHPKLQVPAHARIVNKGIDPAQEAYSGFQGTSLADELQAAGIQQVFVCGLATDYCVKQTALDAIRNGFAVLLIEDACRGVDIPPGSAARAIEEMKANGVMVCRSEEFE